MQLQPRPNAFGMRKYFSGNYVIASPKSSKDQKKRSSPQIFPKSSEDQKQKRSSPKIEEFLSSKSSEDHQKKNNKKSLHRNLGL